MFYVFAVGGTIRDCFVLMVCALAELLRQDGSPSGARA